LYKFTIDFEFSKFRTKKLQIVITFDRELGLRHLKIKVARNKVKNASQLSKGVGPPKFLKFHHLLLDFFLFFFSISELFSRFYVFTSHIYSCKKF